MEHEINVLLQVIRNIAHKVELNMKTTIICKIRDRSSAALAIYP